MTKKEQPNFEILDSTLREGIQSIHPIFHDRGIVFSEEQSLKIAELLISFGVDYIEIGAPVRSKISKRIIKKVVGMSRDTQTKVVIHTRCVKEDIAEVVELGVDGINLFLNATKHKKISRDENIEIISDHLDFIDKISDKKIIKRFSFEDSFRTPLHKIGKSIFALEQKTDRLGVPDTTGMTEPKDVKKIFSYLRNTFPAMELECHFHNDLGLAIANAITAIRAGATIIDTTILGLGERNGIVPLSGLCAILCKDEKNRERLFNRYNVKLLSKIDQTVAGMLGIEIPLNMPITGPGYFSHVSGIHANGFAQNATAYESLVAEDFGSTPFVSWASSVLGKSSLLHRAKELQIDITVEEAQKLADYIRELAKEKGAISPNEVDSLIAHNTSFHNQLPNAH